MSHPLLTALGSVSGPVRELEAPLDPKAPYRVEARYYGAQVRFCHRSYTTWAGAIGTFAAEVAEAELCGYACVVVILRGGRCVRRCVTAGEA